MDAKDQRGSLFGDEASQKGQKIPVIHPTLEDIGLPVSNDPDELNEPFEAALRAVEVERYQGNPQGPDIAAHLTFPQ